MSECSYFNRSLCRSCELIELPHSEQLAVKTQRLAEITGLTPETAFAGERWGFRHKVKLTVGGTCAQPLIGLLSPDLKNITELPECPIQSAELNREQEGLKNFITRWALTPYDISTKRGELKGLILSYSPSTGEKMLRFVLRSKEALDRIRLGLSELNSFQIVSVNIQPVPHALLEGSEEIILTPKQALCQQLGAIELRYPPSAFMQTNSHVAAALYQEAVTWLANWKSHRVLDLFCGVGGFALHLAQAGHEVLGVEINPHAIEYAQLSARKQKLSAQFATGPAERMIQLAQDWKASVILVNPPRRGLGEGLKLIQALNPAVLLYSSCNGESLKDDISALHPLFIPLRTKVFDMFPNSHHFESLTMLVRS